MEYLEVKAKRKKYKKYYQKGNAWGNLYGYYGAPSIENYLKWRLLFNKNIETTFNAGETAEDDFYTFYDFTIEEAASYNAKKIKELICSIEKKGETAENNGWTFYRGERKRKYCMPTLEFGGADIEAIVDKISKAVAS